MIEVAPILIVVALGLLGYRPIMNYVKRAEKKLARQRLEVGPNGWTCHICGDYRPDANISVYSSTGLMAGGAIPIPIQRNTRYCNDRSSCIKAARA